MDSDDDEIALLLWQQTLREEHNKKIRHYQISIFVAGLLFLLANTMLDPTMSTYGLYRVTRKNASTLFYLFSFLNRQEPAMFELYNYQHAVFLYCAKTLPGDFKNRLHLSVCPCVCTCEYVYVYVCMCVCVCPPMCAHCDLFNWQLLIFLQTL